MIQNDHINIFPFTYECIEQNAYECIKQTKKLSCVFLCQHIKKNISMLNNKNGQSISFFLLY